MAERVAESAVVAGSVISYLPTYGTKECALGGALGGLVHFLATGNTSSVLIANSAFSLTIMHKGKYSIKQIVRKIINSSEYCLGMNLVLKLV
jgi:hypothetical protein